MDRSKKLFNIVTLAPLIAAPALAVEFPRILAYMPIISGVFGALILIFMLKEKPVVPKALVIFTLSLMALVSLNLLWSVEFDVSFNRVKKLLILLPLYALFFGVLNTGKRYLSEKVPYYILISCAFAALLTSADLMAGSPLYRLTHDVAIEDYRSTAVFNRGAVVCVLMALASYMAYICTGRKGMENSNHRLFKVAIVVPVVVMLCLIQSQSAQLAFILGIAFYALFPFSHKALWYVLFAAIAVFILVNPLLVQIIHQNLPASFASLPVIKDAYLSDRFEIWDFVARYALTSPLVGHGSEITKTLENVFSFGTQAVLHPHSMVLQVWIEFGLLGVMLLIAAIGGLIAGIYHRLPANHARAALTSFVVCFTIAGFSYGMWQGWWLGLLCMVAGIHVITTHKQE